ncbi:DUF4328 domain-containing protein [Streptodolium elevatio]
MACPYCGGEGTHAVGCPGAGQQNPAGSPQGYPPGQQPYGGRQQGGEPYSGQQYQGQQPYPGQQYGQPYPAAPPPPGDWGMQGPGQGQIRRVSSMVTALNVLIGITIAGAVLSVFAYVQRAMLVGDVLDGELKSKEDADDADAFVSATGISMLVFLAAGIVFMIWLHRARKNIELFGPPPHGKLGAGWAIGGWFVPLANLVLPKLVVDDVWRGSEPTGSPAEQRSGKTLILAWWLVFVVSEVLFFAGTFTRGDDGNEDGMPKLTKAEDLDAWQTADWLLAAGYGLLVVAGVLAIMVVRRISAAQAARGA